MEDTEEINSRIAKNLIFYRKKANLTQAELAQKINYSDKSVSKWESGAGVPDVYILLELSALYGVSVDELVGKTEKKDYDKVAKTNQNLIILLSSSLVWLVATIGFVLFEMFASDKAWWLAFVYAVVANAVVTIVFSMIWKRRLFCFISVSVLIWSALTAVFLTAIKILASYGKPTDGVWLLFILGVPLQVLETIWGFFRASKKKNGK